MNPNVIVDSGGLERVGFWIGLCVSLGLFTLIWREHRLARLLQYLLVGTATGWLFVLVWTSLIQPRIVIPMGSGDLRARVLGPLFLFVLLASATALPYPSAPDGPLSQFEKPIRILKAAASVAASAILAFAAASVLGGMLIGTLLPQMIVTAQTGWFLLGTSLVTALTLLAYATGAHRVKGLPKRVAGVVQGMSALGQPLLMLAAGMVFARLMTSRMTLLGAFLERLFDSLDMLFLTDWVGRLGG